MTDSSAKRTTRERLAAGLFWSWNLIFLAFMTLGFAPRIVPALIVDVRSGVVPVHFLLYALVLTCIPVVAVVLGFTVLRGAPMKQFALGYVVEGPLMLLLAIRFFLIRQATPGLVMLMALAILGMASFLWYLLDGQGEERGGLVGWLRLFGLTLMAFTSLYAAVWIAFYAVPLAGAALVWLADLLGDLASIGLGLSEIVRDLVRDGLVWVPVIVLGFLLVIYTATLFVLAPIVIPLLSVTAWWRSLRSLSGRYGWLRPAVSVGLAVLASVMLFVVANNQPQRKAFALLQDPPASQDEAQALLAREQSIRSGLLNAYLSPFRYISADGEVVHIRNLYQDVLGLDWGQAIGVQRAYEGVARPLLYAPVHPPDAYNWRDNRALFEEPLEAASLYQTFFDESIVDGERDTIVDAVRTSWSANEVESAWKAVDDREVWLQRQEVNVDEHGDWAEVELLEVYENQTGERQEALYYFHLPESAVLTGVWLGNSEDRASRFAHVVAPRGAAQATYRAEKVINIDPALLEQIGPRQYRLRVFPIPPLEMQWNENRTRRTVEEAPPLYLWLTYTTMASGDAWPLPQLAEKRNVYWDKESDLLVNGQPAGREGDAWLPESVPATGSVTPQPHRVDLPGGQTVTAVPQEQVELPGLPEDLRLAVVLDRSRSMAAYAPEVSTALVRLEQMAGPQTDVYLTSSPYRGEEPAIRSLGNVRSVLYFGGQNPAELLSQYEGLRAGRAYDALVVLSDGGGYELGEDQAELPPPGAPVWIVHLDSDIPLGYDDPTLEYIQASGGGVVGSVDEALERLALSLDAPSGEPGGSAASQDVLDGYVWAVQDSAKAPAAAFGTAFVADEAGFEALAARRLVLAEMQRHSGRLDDLQVLDQVHALAEQNSIVTPYSSMIVLVTEEQLRRLERRSNAADRFEREYEAVGETTPVNPLPLRGVPEPHEWLLLALAAGLLLYYAYKRMPALHSRR